MTPGPRTSPRLPLLLALLPAICATALLAAGCKTVEEDWSSVPAERAPHADLVQQVHAVPFAAGSDHLTPKAIRQLDAFLAGIHATTTDTALVIGGEGANATGRRVETVSAYLEHLGLHVAKPRGDFGIEPPAANTVSVVVRRYLVTLPACPDWTGRPGRNWNNTPSSNWGCATATNLGLMVTDPTDLAAPRAPGPMDANFAVLSIQRYREGKTTPLAPEDVGTVEAQQKTSSGSGGSDQ